MADASPDLRQPVIQFSIKPEQSLTLDEDTAVAISVQVFSPDNMLVSIVYAHQGIVHHRVSLSAALMIGAAGRKALELAYAALDAEPPAPGPSDAGTTALVPRG